MSAIRTFEGHFYSQRLLNLRRFEIFKDIVPALTHTYTYKHKYTCTHKHIWTHKQTNTYTYTHIYIWTSTHTHTHTHTRTKAHTCILFHTPTCVQQTKTWHYTNTRVIICNTQSNICCVGLLRENNNLTWHTQMVMTYQQIYITYKTNKACHQIVITSHNILLGRNPHVQCYKLPISLM